MSCRLGRRYEDSDDGRLGLNKDEVRAGGTGGTWV